MKNFIKYFARFGTAILLMVIVWSCARVPGLQEEKMGVFIKIPFVRVLLEENKKDVAVTADGTFAIECLKNGNQSIYYSSQPVKVKNQGQYVTVYNHKGYPIEEKLDEVNIIPRGNNNRIQFDKKRYRGILRILPNGGNVQLINVVYMEDYLKGVVPPN